MVFSFKKSSNKFQKLKNSQIKKFKKKGFTDEQAKSMVENLISYKKLKARKNVLNKYGTNVATQSNKELLKTKKKLKKK
jgi:hypothetical protein